MTAISQTLLMATAGAVKPVQQAIVHAKPMETILIGTDQTWSQWGGVEQLPPGTRPVTVSNADNFVIIVETCRREVTPLVSDWRKLNPEGRIIADFTGGTKPMSAALTGSGTRRRSCLRHIA